MLKKISFLLFALSALLASCTTIPKQTINLNEKHIWKNELFTLNPQNLNISAEGEVTMWIDAIQFKGKFTGDYQILSSSTEKWRIIITGPFNISVATVIINGDSSHVFHDGIWESKPWNEISSELFNAKVDGDLFSVILGGRFNFEGVCAEIGNGTKLCDKNGIYYKIQGSEIIEILSGNLYVVKEGEKWVGVRDDKFAFIFKNKKLDSSISLKESLFELPRQEKDQFDEL